MKDGGLPAGWVQATITELGLPTSTRNLQSSGEGTFAYIDIEAVDNLRQRVERPRNLQKRLAPSRARNIVLAGDVIFSLVRPYLKNIAIVPAELDNAIASTAFFVCRPGTGIDSRYIFNFLRQDSFIASIVTYGNSPPSAHDDEFARLVVPVPPAKEQERIADALDELLSDLDAGVAAVERARDKLKLYRASVLKAAVEGALTAGWRQQYTQTEPASELLKRILAERRRRWEAEQLRKFAEKGREPPKNWKAKYKEPVAPRAEKLAGLPNSWCWATVEQLSSGRSGSIQSGPFGSQLLHSEFVNEGPLAIGIDNVLDGKFSPGSQHRISSAKFASLRKFEARPLDVVVTVMATVGRACVLPAALETSIITKHCYRITTAEQMVVPAYLAIALRAEGATRHHMFGNIRGQTRPGINGPILKQAPVSLPPTAEQEAILEAVEDQLSIIDHLEADLTAKLASAQALRQSMLRDAFSGKLVRQDLRDEPAFELLKRIAAERAQRTREAAGTKKLNGPNPRRAAKTLAEGVHVKATNKKENGHGRIADR